MNGWSQCSLTDRAVHRLRIAMAGQTSTSSCLTPDLLAAFVEGELPPEEAEAIEAHADRCPDCLRVLEVMRDAASTDRSVAPPSVAERSTTRIAADPEHPPLGAPGTSIGRYVVLEVAGQGAMGTVYAAYDAELDRRVALKVLHRATSTPVRADAIDRAQTRLLEEAQALGQVSHRNVVVVHDVGTVGDRIYVAMEYVDGPTLGGWLLQPRSVAEILEVFAQAGEGLAAAHDADLVHRDFKPANVLVDKTGRAVVVDFGFARPVVDDRPVDAGATHDSTPAGSSEDAPTGTERPTGTLGCSGTPAYMAPEHRAGRPTPRSDQYSFCVALWEALFGQRPHDGEHAEILAALGPRSDPPATPAKVPRRIRSALVRGLSPDPQDRFATMRELLAALAPPSPGRRGVKLATGGVIAALGGSVVFLAARPPAGPADEPCTAAADRIAGVWDDARRARVRAGLLATDRPHAAPTAQLVTEELDRYADRWVEHHTQACQATRVHGDQSVEHMDLRMLCLERNRLALDALAGVFEEADDGILDEAANAVDRLPRIDGCADIETLSKPLPVPDDPQTRTRLEALQTERARAAALRDAGKTKAARETVEKLVAEAQELGYRPLLADALQMLGDLQARTGDLQLAEGTLYRALWEAQAAHHDFIAAQAWNNLLYTVAFELARHDEADRLGEHARSAIERLGGHDDLEAQRLAFLGHAYRESGRFDEAVALHRQAVELSERRLGGEPRRLIPALAALATSLKEQGDFPGSEQVGARAIEVFASNLPADHPNMADLLANQGNLHRRMGQVDLALSEHQRAVEILRKAGAPRIRIAAADYNIATILHGQGEYAQAEENYRGALETFREELGEDHPNVGACLNALSLIKHETGDQEAALSFGEQALAQQERALGPNHPKLAYPLTNLGLIAQALGQPDVALARQERALSLLEPDHPMATSVRINIGLTLYDLGRNAESLEVCTSAHQAAEEHALPELRQALLCMADAHLALGHRRDGLALLERAVEQHTEEHDPRIGAEIEFALARALGPDDRARARALAESAATTFAEHDLHDRNQDVSAWLERHPLRG